MTLVQLFTLIANAIRNKKGTTNKITPIDFANEIDGIPTGITPTGTIEITENGNVDVTNYAEANVNVESNYNANTETTLTWQSTTIQGNTNYLKRLIKELPTIDCVNATSLSYTFQWCSSLEEVTLINTGNVTTIASAFDNCKKIKKINLFDTSKVTRMESAFRSCNLLETIPVFDTSSVTNMSYTFYESPSLSDNSLNNIMQMCINATKLTSGKALYSIGLSQTQIERCRNLSNYQALLDAGWTE